MLATNSKSQPGIAAVLSFVFNGLGQLYNGQIFKGLLVVFLSAINLLVLVLGSVLIALWLLGKVSGTVYPIAGLGLFIIGLIAICIIGIYSIIDAYKVASRQ